jgi:hypothetical protein
MAGRFVEIIDLPARALTSTCFFSYTLNIANNPFFAYITGLAWQAGKTTNGSTCSSGLLVDIFEFPGRYVFFIHGDVELALDFRARPFRISQEPDELRIRLGIETFGNIMHR